MELGTCPEDIDLAFELVRLALIVLDLIKEPLETDIDELEYFCVGNM